MAQDFGMVGLVDEKFAHLFNLHEEALKEMVTMRMTVDSRGAIIALWNG